jgi:hypothetical protein
MLLRVLRSVLARPLQLVDEKIIVRLAFLRLDLHVFYMLPDADLVFNTSLFLNFLL